MNEKKDAVRTWKVNATAGLNRVDWDLLVDATTIKGLPTGRRPFILPGKYTLALSMGAEKREAPLLNASLNSFRREGDAWIEVSWGDVAHLAEVGVTRYYGRAV